jgi:hypothetical protein
MTRKKHGYWYFLFSLFDLSIIGCLVASVVLESSYLPASYGGCGEADTWQLIGNATNLFSLVQNVSTFEQDDYVSPGTACDNLIDTWVLSIVIMWVHDIP